MTEAAGFRDPLVPIDKWPNLSPRPEVTAMPAHSATPLIRKLGIKPAARILFVNAPAAFAVTLGPLPADVELLRTDGAEPSDLDLTVFFARSKAEL